MCSGNAEIVSLGKPMTFGFKTMEGFCLNSDYAIAINSTEIHKENSEIRKAKTDISNFP